MSASSQRAWSMIPYLCDDLSNVDTFQDACIANELLMSWRQCSVYVDDA